MKRKLKNPRYGGRREVIYLGMGRAVLCLLKFLGPFVYPSTIVFEYLVRQIYKNSTNLEIN